MTRLSAMCHKSVHSYNFCSRLNPIHNTDGWEGKCSAQTQHWEWGRPILPTP